MSSYLRNLFGGSSSPQNTMHPTSSSSRSSRPQARRVHSYQAPPPPIYTSGAPMAKTSSRASNRSARSGASVRFSDSPVEMTFPVIPPLPRGVTRSRASSMSASGHGHTGGLGVPPLPAQMAHPYLYTHSRSSSASSINSLYSGMPQPQSSAHSSPSSTKRRRPSLPQSSSTYSGSGHVPIVPPRPSTGVAPARFNLHPLLAFNKRYPTVSYNVMWKPSHHTVIHPATHVCISAVTLGQLATIPALMELTLTSPHLPWTIVVHARPGSGGVTNLDVLTAVHDNLRKRTSAQECELFGYSGSKLRKVAAAFERRCTQSGGGWERGWRRVDCLGDKTTLVGVEVSGSKLGMAKVIFSD